MPPLSILIKPASSNCNLRCKYCFYHSVAEMREVENFGIMKYNTLEIIVQKALKFADRSCTFAFQGGEPTLAGLDFFKQLIELQTKYNTKKVQIHNAIQTNGIAIDNEWAKFLAKNKFLVGISLDGPKEINDSIRFDFRNVGSFNRVMNTINLFSKHSVKYNILCVVNAYVARHVNKVYSFFKKNSFTYLQFIPCLDPLNEKMGGYDYSLTPKRYATFLKTLFDMWYEDIINGIMISIRYFDNLVGMFMGMMPEACDMTGICNCQFVVEADGGVYPCDFYVIDEWYLGNIKEKGFKELKFSENGKRFVEISRHINLECAGCKWLNLCRGGCRRFREPFKDSKPVQNYFCPAFREFFEYSVKRLQHLAAIFSSRL